MPVAAIYDIHGNLPALEAVRAEIRAEGMATWPMTVRREISELGRVLFCHATPRDDNEIFTVRTPAESLVPAFEEADADVVVCGHTHMQFDRTIGEVRVVNAGSAGMPFGEPGAYWLRLGHGVEMRRTSYDLDAAAVRIEATGCPQVPGLNPDRPLAEDVMLESFERSKKPTQESGRIP